MAREATTIYIDDSTIWALTARGKRPQKWASMPLEPGLVSNGVVQEQDSVARKIKELWQADKIGARKVIAGVSGINCLYRLVTLPELPRDLLPEALKREAARILAVPLEQLYLSWQTLPTSKGETLVYLTAFPKNSVDALISTLRKAGLNPYIMDLKPLSLVRTISEPRAIILDIQSTSFDIVIMTEAIPRVVRSLPLTPEASLEEKASIIRDELDRAITFYNSGHMDKPIEVTVPLLVSGELAQHQDAWKLLTGRLERPVQVLPSPLETSENFPSSQYMTNIGLALKEIGDRGATAHSLVNLNILPEVYRPKTRPISELLFVPVIIAGIALIALGAFAYLNASEYTNDLRSQWASISQTVASISAESTTQAKEISALAEQVPPLEETADAFDSTINDFHNNKTPIIGDLGQVNKAPEAIHLQNISHNSNTLTVNGLGDDEDAVFGYAEDLRDSGRFALVVITDMHQAKQQMGFTFKLTK